MCVCPALQRLLRLASRSAKVIGRDRRGIKVHKPHWQPGRIGDVIRKSRGGPNTSWPEEQPTLQNTKVDRLSEHISITINYKERVYSMYVGQRFPFCGYCDGNAITMEKVTTSLYKHSQPLVCHINGWLSLYNDVETFSINIIG